jgi:hypothetical protein
MTALCIYFGSSLIHNNYYKYNAGWQNYFEFNKIRAEIVDTPKIQYNSKVLEKIDWSDNDYLMFKSGFFSGSSVFSTENLKKFSYYSSVKLQPYHTLKNITELLGKNFFLEISYILILFLIIILWSYNQKKFFFFFIIWEILVIVYLSIFMKLPLRVGYPVFMFIGLTLILLSHIQTYLMFKNKIFLSINYKFICVFILILSFAFSSQVGDLLKESRINVIKSRAIVANLNKIYQLNPEGIFIHLAATLPIEDVSPFISGQKLPPINIIWLGWTSDSPISLDFMRNLGIKDLYLDIPKRNDVYLVMKQEELLFYKQYMMEHYGKCVNSEEVLDRISYRKGKIFRVHYCDN